MKIYQKRSLIFLYIIGCLVFVILGLTLLYLYHRNILDEMFIPIIAWLGIIFFGIIGLPVLMMSFIKPKLILEILCDGFNSNWGYIEWKNVDEISLVIYRGTKFIMFNTKNILNKHKHRQNANRLLTGYNFDIALSGSGVNIEEVYNIMLKRVHDAQNM